MSQQSLSCCVEATVSFMRISDVLQRQFESFSTENPGVRHKLPILATPNTSVFSSYKDRSL